MDLLITDNVQNARSLIDLANRTQVVSGIDVKSIGDIAREIVLHELAQKGEPADIREPGRLACAFEIRIIMKNLLDSGRLNYFVTGDGRPIDDFRTCEEVYAKLNEVRLGFSKGTFETSPDPKLTDMRNIKECFEKTLKEKQYYDSARYITEASDPALISSWRKDNPDAAIYKLLFQEDNIRDQERKLLDRLTDDDFGSCFQTYFGKDIREVCRGKHTVSSARAYGISNEVSDIAHQIQSERIPYGDVTIYYPGQGYETYLNAEFASRNIPLTFSDGRNPKGSAYFRLARGILSWAENGFYYDQLRPVFASGILQHNDQPAPDYMYEVEMKAGIGFGTERYHVYADRIREKLKAKAEKINECRNETEKSDLEEELKSLQIREDLADYLESLVDIFEKSSDSSVIWHKLIDWLKNYTRKSSPDKERSDYLSLLENQQGEMNLIHIDDRKESCRFLEDLLDTLRSNDPDRPNAVRAVRIGKPCIEERHHVWMIGLSANEIESAQTDSPVLNDEELKNIIVHPVHLAASHAGEIRKALEDTLSTVNGCVHLTYTYYEINALLNWNPSSFYMDRMKDEKRNPIAPEDVKCGVRFEEKTGHFETKTDLLKKYIRGDKEDDAGNSFSATGAETLLTCHRRFYLKYILGIREPEKTELKADEWLANKDRGNLFHSVLCDYAKKCLIQKNPVEFDSVTFTEIFQNRVEEFMAVHTCLNEETIEREQEEYRTILTRYLQQLHRDMNENGWHVVMAEKELGPVVLTEGKPYELVRFKGTIDRCDYRLNEDGTKTYRIIDYKTGSRESLQQNIVHGKKIQHQVYMELLRRSSVQAESVYFEYDMINDDPDNYNPIHMDPDEEKTAETAESIRSCIESFDCMKTENREDCRYCPYQKLCGRCGENE